MSDYDIVATFKLLLIGNTNVGKSSLLLRFIDDAFLPPEETSATIGKYLKKISIVNLVVILTIIRFMFY
jgi:GTPase SAR1 family protein